MGILSRLFGRTTVDDEPFEDQLASFMQNPLFGEPPLPSVDRLENGTGDFGSLTNPIPVNGPLGERIYLNRLRSETNHLPYFYQRTGSVEGGVIEYPLDRYELVTVDGSEWRVLYFSMYHPRRSQEAPAGMLRIPWPKGFKEKIMLRMPMGSTTTVENFPFGLPAALEAWGRQGEVPPELANGVRLAVERIVAKMPPETRRPDALDAL